MTTSSKTKFKHQKYVGGVWVDQDTGSGGSGTTDHAALSNLNIANSGHTYKVDQIVGQVQSLQDKLKGNTIHVFDFVPESERQRITNKLVDPSDPNEVDHSVYIQAAIDYKKTHPEITEIVIDPGWWMIEHFLELYDINDLILSGSNKGAILYTHPNNLYIPANNYLAHFLIGNWFSHYVMALCLRSSNVVIKKITFNGNSNNVPHNNAYGQYIQVRECEKFIVCNNHFTKLKQYSAIDYLCKRSGWVDNTFEDLAYGVDIGFVAQKDFSRVTGLNDFHASARSFPGWVGRLVYEIKITYTGTDPITDPDRFVWRRTEGASISIKTIRNSINNQNTHITIYAPGHTLVNGQECMISASRFYWRETPQIVSSVNGDYFDIDLPYLTDETYVGKYIEPTINYFKVPGPWTTTERSLEVDIPDNIIVDYLDPNRPTPQLPNQHPLLKDDGSIEGGNLGGGSYGGADGRTMDVYFDSATGHTVGDVFKYEWVATGICQFTCTSGYDKRSNPSQDTQTENFFIKNNAIGFKHELTGSTGVNQHNWTLCDNYRMGGSNINCDGVLYANNVNVGLEVLASKNMVVCDNSVYHDYPADGVSSHFAVFTADPLYSWPTITSDIYIFNNTMIADTPLANGTVDHRKVFILVDDIGGVGLKNIHVFNNTLVSRRANTQLYGIAIYSDQPCENVKVYNNNVFGVDVAAVKPHYKNFVNEISEKHINSPAESSPIFARNFNTYTHQDNDSSDEVYGITNYIEKKDNYNLLRLISLYNLNSVKGAGNINNITSASYFNIVNHIDAIVAEVTAIYANTLFLSNGKVTYCEGIKVKNAYIDPNGNGSIDYQYGIFIDNIQGAATNYAIYSAGGQSYHAGKFTFNDTIILNNDITFGGGAYGIDINGDMDIRDITARTYYGDGSQLTGIDSDQKVITSGIPSIIDTAAYPSGTVFILGTSVTLTGTKSVVYSFMSDGIQRSITNAGGIYDKDGTLKTTINISINSGGVTLVNVFGYWYLLSLGSHKMSDHTDYSPAPTIPLLFATNSNSFTRTGGVWGFDTIPNWTQKEIDSNYFTFNATTGVVTILKAGRYKLKFLTSVESTSATAHESGIQFKINGATLSESSYIHFSANGERQHLIRETIENLLANDTVECCIFSSLATTDKTVGNTVTWVIEPI